MEEVLIENVGITELTEWLIKNGYTKKNGKDVTVSDVQQYAYRQKKLPNYMGGHAIRISRKKYYKRTFNLVSNGKVQ